jgi:hypothetical protein
MTRRTPRFSYPIYAPGRVGLPPDANLPTPEYAALRQAAREAEREASEDAAAVALLAIERLCATRGVLPLALYIIVELDAHITFYSSVHLQVPSASERVIRLGFRAFTLGVSLSNPRPLLRHHNRRSTRPTPVRVLLQ